MVFLVAEYHWQLRITILMMFVIKNYKRNYNWNSKETGTVFNC
jgi:hypothetical protein